MRNRTRFHDQFPSSVSIAYWLQRHNVPLILIAVHVILLARSGAVHSPTENESQHLVAGLHHLHTGTFGLYSVNPPLIKTVAALPVALVGYVSDWSRYSELPGSRPEFDMGETFVSKNGRASLRMMAMARWACIPFSIVGAWVCFLWARDLYGTYSGYMACCLWCFSPMIIGNASLITPDAHAAALGLAACYTFWRWLKRPSWLQAAVTGGLLGLAELSKTTLVLFYPLWPIIWFIYRFPSRHSMSRGQWLREASMLLLRMAIGIYILNLGYLFEGSFTKLKDFQFVSRIMAENATGYGNRFKDTWVGEVFVPFPKNYIIGIDVQQRDFESFSRPSYLGGLYQSHGWWYYYCYAVSVKAASGTLGLMALAVIMQFSRPWPRARYLDMMVLLTPAALIFAVVSMKCGFSHHSRYILPSVPFVFIWISQLALSLPGPLHFVIQKRAPGAIWIFGTLAGVGSAFLLCCSVISSLTIYPHNLSYFNEISGGPANGAKHLINSNIDWGQDLLFLEKWINQRSNQTPVFLAFYNYFNPFDLDIEGVAPWPFEANNTTLNPDVPDGFYAISINLLYEYPWPVRGAGKRRYRIDSQPLAYLRSVECCGLAGYSIRIFSAEQIRAAYKASESRSRPDR